MGSEPDAYKEVFMAGGAFNASRYNNKNWMTYGIKLP